MVIGWVEFKAPTWLVKYIESFKFNIRPSKFVNLLTVVNIKFLFTMLLQIIACGTYFLTYLGHTVSRLKLSFVRLWSSTGMGKTHFSFLFFFAWKRALQLAWCMLLYTHMMSSVSFSVAPISLLLAVESTPITTPLPCLSPSLSHGVLFFLPRNQLQSRLLSHVFFLPRHGFIFILP